jgi:hypothetical protein
MDSNNQLYNKLLKNQNADVFSKALSQGQIKKVGNALKKGYSNTSEVFQQGYQHQMENLKKVGQLISNNSTPLVWFIIFALFFIIIVI